MSPRETTHAGSLVYYRYRLTRPSGFDYVSPSSIEPTGHRKGRRVGVKGSSWTSRAERWRQAGTRQRLDLLAVYFGRAFEEPAPGMSFQGSIEELGQVVIVRMEGVL